LKKRRKAAQIWDETNAIRETAMTTTRLAGMSALILLMTVGAAPAQTRSFLPLSEKLFTHLFDAHVSARLRVPAEQPRASALRERPANRRCPGCEDRPGTVHLIADSPLLTDIWIARHQYQSSDRAFGDGAAIADFWYDAVHRRILTRSAAFHDVDDPADIRLGRAPGTYPNGPDFDTLLGEGATVGQVGFDKWTHDGFSSYFAAIQGTVRDDDTGYLVLATATGQAGITRTGSRFDADDLVRHVRLHPSGQLEVGFETPADARPDPLLMVRGAAAVEGAIRVEGVGGNVPHACTLRTAVSRGRQVRVSCEPAELAISGGGSCDRGDLRASRPIQTGAVPDGWEVSCNREASQTAFAICCVQ
jgi:hypothetical protein